MLVTDYARPNLAAMLDLFRGVIATIIKCSSVSVFLFDFDSIKHARADDFYPNGSETRPVPRIEVDVRRSDRHVAANLMSLGDAGRSWNGPVPHAIV
jgi:hypothetical protein